MHYTDREQIEENILELVIYIHTTDKNDVIDINITSIHECKYFNPRFLSKILKNPNKYFKKHVNTLKVENFWLLTIKEIDYDTFEIINKINVTYNENKFLQLH